MVWVTYKNDSSVHVCIAACKERFSSWLSEFWQQKLDYILIATFILLHAILLYIFVLFSFVVFSYSTPSVMSVELALFVRVRIGQIYVAPVHTETFSCVFVLFTVLKGIENNQLITLNNTKDTGKRFRVYVA